MYYYFAYGSNMDEVQMKERCPGSRIVGKVCLSGYRLAFTIYSPTRKCGCADIVKSPMDVVWGLLYTITKENMNQLDFHEGVSHEKYKRIAVDVIDGNGNMIKAESYEVVNKAQEYQPPSKEYLDKLIEAARKFSFPKDYRDLLNAFTIGSE